MKDMGYFRTFDGTRLFYRVRAGEAGKPWLLILHGLGEHSGRFANVDHEAEKLGFSTAAFDYRGHGRSEGQEMYVETFEDFLKDADAFIEMLEKERQAAGPYLVAGNSLGGLVAFSYALRRPERIRALFLFSPCFGIVIPKILKHLNRTFSESIPRFSYMNPVYPPFLTHDEEEMEKYKKDPFVRRKVSTRLLHAMIDQSDYLLGSGSWNVPFPVYGLLAGDERVVDFGATKEIFSKIRSPRKVMKVFSKFYHEIFHEKEREESLRALAAYLAEAGVSKTA
ncbi:MAG: alpha/beta hydrolase [Candidatus Omnitrophota bacterium]